MAFTPQRPVLKRLLGVEPTRTGEENFVEESGPDGARPGFEEVFGFYQPNLDLRIPSPGRGATSQQRVPPCAGKKDKKHQALKGRNIPPSGIRPIPNILLIIIYPKLFKETTVPILKCFFGVRLKIKVSRPFSVGNGANQ